MAKVPYKGTLSVAPSDTPLPPQNASRASAQNFGGMIGQAVEGLGKQLERTSNVFTEHALKDQALANEAATNDIFLWTAQESGKSTVEFGALEGKNKVDAYPAYVKRQEEIFSEGVKRAGNNPAVKRSFENQWKGRLASIIVGGAGEAATAKKKYEGETSDARVKNAVDDTLTNYQDEGRFTQNIGIVRKEVQYKGQLHGWSPEKLKEEEREHVSKVYGARIQGIGRTDPFSARQFYEKNRANISGADQIAVDKFLLEQDVGVGTRVDSDAIIKGDKAPTNLGPSLGNPAATPAERRSQFTTPFELAKSFVGANETRDRDVLASFIQRSTGTRIDPAYTAWCAGWLNGVFQASGIKGTGSLAARSFLNFGSETQTPQIGDVAVFARGNDPSKGHVGLFAGFDAKGNIKVLGGNQADSVSETTMPKESLLGFRTPPSPNGNGIEEFRRERAFTFFREKGFAPHQAAGMVGNLMQENFKFDPNLSHDGGKGIGLAGWNADRRAKLVAFAGEDGETNFEKQLAFMWDELNSSEKKALTNIMSAGDAESAAEAAEGYFRPGTPMSDKRRAYAKESFEKYGKQASAAPVQYAQAPVDNVMSDATGAPETLAPKPVASGDAPAKDAPTVPDPGPLTPESGAEWLEQALTKGREWARLRAPNNPRYEDQLLARIESEYNRVKRVRTQTERGSYLEVMTVVMGDYNDTMIRSEDTIYNNPVLSQRFNALTSTQQRAVMAQIKRNSLADIPLTPERRRRFLELKGIATDDPEKFLSMNTSDFGTLPTQQTGELLNLQKTMGKKLQDSSRLNSAMYTVTPMLQEAGITRDPRDEGKMTLYNQFRGAFQTKLQEFHSQNKKFPNETELMQIAAGLLKESKNGIWETIFGGTRAFEVPSKWNDPRTGKSRSLDEWKQDFTNEVGREPTHQDMYQLYQKAIGNAGR